MVEVHNPMGVAVVEGVGDQDNILSYMGVQGDRGLGGQGNHLGLVGQGNHQGSHIGLVDLSQGNRQGCH